MEGFGAAFLGLLPVWTAGVSPALSAFGGVLLATVLLIRLVLLTSRLVTGRGCGATVFGTAAGAGLPTDLAGAAGGVCFAAGGLAAGGVLTGGAGLTDWLLARTAGLAGGLFSAGFLPAAFLSAGFFAGLLVTVGFVAVVFDFVAVVFVAVVFVIALVFEGAAGFFAGVFAAGLLAVLALLFWVLPAAAFPEGLAPARTLVFTAAFFTGLGFAVFLVAISGSLLCFTNESCQRSLETWDRAGPGNYYTRISESAHATRFQGVVPDRRD